MSKLLPTIFVSFALLPTSVQSSDHKKEQYRSWFDAERKELETQLQAELQEEGLSETDAVSQASKSMDSLAKCFAETEDDVAGTDGHVPEHVLVRIGSASVIFPAHPCVYEFVESAGVSLD